MPWLKTTKRPKKKNPPSARVRRYRVDRIPLNSGGYTSSGRYYGNVRGTSIFDVTDTETNEAVVIRAKDAKEAREMGAAALARRPNPQRRHHARAPRPASIGYTVPPHVERELRARSAHAARKRPRADRPIPYRLNPKSAADAELAEELQLYAANTGELYAQRQSIEALLVRKMRAGKYDPKLAPAAWLYWFDAAAKRYVKEIKPETFTKATRELAASEWAKTVEPELRRAARVENPASSAPSPRGTLTELGRLVEMTLASAREGKLPAHKETIAFHGRARLCTNARGRLIIVSGPAGAAMHRAATDARALKKYVREHWGRRGKGKVETFDAANPSVPHERIAEIATVVYATKKGKDRGTVEYVHDFGTPRPVLARNATGLLVLGGKYRMTTHGIVG